MKKPHESNLDKLHIEKSNGKKISVVPQNGKSLKNGTKTPKNKCDLGAYFVAPDGGWGWIVVIAAGCSNLFTFPVLQQFGLLFADKLHGIGLSTSEITTIINLNPCITSMTGLLNGPMFRRFTYRQVGLFGALLVTISIYLTSISNSFFTYLLTFSILYGAGSGINSSANSLALNTYFKEKRRIATGLSWTITGMGPILMPQLIAVLLPLYGVDGSLLIYTGLAFNAVVCALAFQPVQWHVKNTEPKTDEELQLKQNTAAQIECDYCLMTKRRNQSIFSSQYLYNADNASATGYEIIDPGVPMLSLANDGWSSRRSLYGSRSSLYSDRPSRFGSRTSTSHNLVGMNRTASINLGTSTKDREKRKISSNNKIEEYPEDGLNGKSSQERVNSENCSTSKVPDVQVNSTHTPVYDMDYINANQSALSSTKNPITPRRKISSSNNFNVEKEVLKNVSQKLEEFVSTGKNKVSTTSSVMNFCTCDEKLRLYLDPQLANDFNDEVINQEKEHHSIWRRIIIFFDLDLLRDFTYVNLMMGVTLGNFAALLKIFGLRNVLILGYLELRLAGNFAELNFSLLTPFVLAEWGFQKPQIALAMSLLGFVDISIRFFVPFFAGKIGWENKTFFLVGILAMAMGRVVITFFQSYTAILWTFCWIGLGKGLRTVFMALVIPSYVPLHRLPAASGLQLLFAGLFYFFVGPLVGYIRDKTNYVTTLHCLNIATYFVATSWILEALYHKYQKRKSQGKSVIDNSNHQKSNIDK